jgi:hypothetical protein
VNDDAQIPLFGDLEPRAHARTADPDTSHAAAHRLSNKQTMLRNLLTVLGSRGPSTSDELVTGCGYTAESGAWKRVSDLVRLGYAEDTDERRPGRSGREQVVRRITERGREVLR